MQDIAIVSLVHSELLEDPPKQQWGGSMKREAPNKSQDFVSACNNFIGESSIYDKKILRGILESPMWSSTAFIMH